MAPNAANSGKMAGFCPAFPPGSLCPFAFGLPCKGILRGASGRPRDKPKYGLPNNFRNTSQSFPEPAFPEPSDSPEGTEGDCPKAPFSWLGPAACPRACAFDSQGVAGLRRPYGSHDQGELDCQNTAQETNTIITLDWEEKTFTVQPYSDELYKKLTRSETKPEAASARASATHAPAKPAPATPAPAKEPSASVPGTPVPSKAQAPARTPAQQYDRPDLIVSHYAGPGKVYLARDMSVEEASRVLDTKLARLMAWNNLKDKKAVLKAGTLIWLTKPTTLKPSARAESKAVSKPEAKPEAKSQTAKASNPAPKTDVSVRQALATAKSQTKAKTSSTTTAPTPAPNPVWSIAPGSLKAQVGSWAARAGYRMVWQADTDLHMAAGATFKGSFAEAVRALFMGLHETGAPYTAHIFHGNHVLHIGDR